MGRSVMHSVGLSLYAGSRSPCEEALGVPIHDYLGYQYVLCIHGLAISETGLTSGYSQIEETAPSGLESCASSENGNDWYYPCCKDPFGGTVDRFTRWDG